MDFNALKAPFPAKDIFWRVDKVSEDRTTARVVPYIQARAVQERLDDIVGPGNWRNSFEDVVLTNRHVAARCRIGIRIEGEWVDKEDGAHVEANVGGATAELAVKGAYSDAFKRAAVLWSIGRYLYAFKAPIVELDEHGRLKEVPKLPLHMLPDGDTTESVVVATPVSVTESSSHATAVREEATHPQERSEASNTSEPAVQSAAADTEQQATGTAVAASAGSPAGSAPEAAEAPAAPAGTPHQGVTVKNPPQALEAVAAGGLAEPFTDEEIAALPTKEAGYVKTIQGHIKGRNSLANLKTYVNGPKMEQNLSLAVRKRLTALIEAAMGQQEMANQA